MQGDIDEHLRANYKAIVEEIPVILIEGQPRDARQVNQGRDRGEKDDLQPPSRLYSLPKHDYILKKAGQIIMNCLERRRFFAISLYRMSRPPSKNRGALSECASSVRRLFRTTRDSNRPPLPNLSRRSESDRGQAGARTL